DLGAVRLRRRGAVAVQLRAVKDKRAAGLVPAVLDVASHRRDKPGASPSHITESVPCDQADSTRPAPGPTSTAPAPNPNHDYPSSPGCCLPSTGSAPAARTSR